MTRSRNRRNLFCLLFAGALLADGARAWSAEELEPYKMVRSLQFVQDSIVLGDHSAGEMQRFLLKTLDQRLRSVQADAFRDPRNVDAVFILAMSGGNPQTLGYLASRDVAGDFDNRLSRMLLRYLQGQGLTTVPSLDELVQEYANNEVGPYLALVAGNITAGIDPHKALDYFDKVRLLSPGTNLEEAALRRAMVINLQASDFPRALDLSAKYVRRFLYSPYASQFADMFVQLVVDSDKKDERDRWTDIVALMDDARAKELYLRIARRAVLAGKDDLAREATANAARLAPDAAAPGDDKTIGRLYRSLANVSSSNVMDAVKSLSEIPDEALSDRDRMLRDAARDVAQQILKSPEALPASADIAAAPGSDAAASHGVEAKPSAGAPAAVGVSQAGASAPPVVDAALQGYLEQNRKKLKQIDSLLHEGVQQ